MQVGCEKIVILNQYLAASHVVDGVTANCYTHSCAGPWHVGKRCHLLFEGDERRSVHDKKPPC